MEKLSKEESQNVQTVAEPKQENPPKPVAASVEGSMAKPPIMQIDLKKIDPNMLKTAENIGVPIGAILKYVADLQEYNISVEARLQAIVNNFEPAVQKTVLNMVNDQRAKAQEQIQQQQAAAPAGSSQPQGGLMAGLLPELLKMVGGTQASSDPFAEMAKSWFMEEMAASRAFKKSFDATVLAKLGSKLAAEVVP